MTARDRSPKSLEGCTEGRVAAGLELSQKVGEILSSKFIPFAGGERQFSKQGPYEDSLFASVIFS